MSKTKPLKFEESVNEPNVVYITTTDLKNKLGDVIDLALIENKEIVLKRHGREILKISKVENKVKKDRDIDLLTKKYFGSIPDLKRDKKFRKDFKILKSD